LLIFANSLHKNCLMDKFNQNNQSKLFLEQLDVLLDKQIVNSDAEFCRLTGYSPQSFSQIRKGKRNVPPELLESAYNQFGIDILYIFSGKKNVHPDVRSPFKFNLVPDPSTAKRFAKKNLDAANHKVLEVDVDEVKQRLDNQKIELEYLREEFENLKEQNKIYREIFEAMSKSTKSVDGG
jgi:transcriptional regulator with XRE-family HTH domain